jgi:hypothetical protein
MTAAGRRDVGARFHTLFVAPGGVVGGAALFAAVSPCSCLGRRYDVRRNGRCDLLKTQPCKIGEDRIELDASC